MVQQHRDAGSGRSRLAGSIMTRTKASTTTPIASPSSGRLWDVRDPGDTLPFLTQTSGSSRRSRETGCSSLGGRRTRRSGPSSIAFLDAHTPPEARGGFDFHGDVADERELVPQWVRDWQATLFDHGWMIPGYPPELGGRNCTPVQTLIYLESWRAGGIPRSRPLPRLRDRRAEPARVRQRRAAGAGAGRDPRRHDLVHRHERAERGLRPRRAADARRARRRPLRRQRPEGLDVATR